MRIANIIEEGRIAGPQIRNLVVASSIKKKNVDVTLIFPIENSEKLVRQCNKFKLKYFKLSIRKLKKNLTGIVAYIFFFPTEVIKLALLLKRKKYDLVHISGGSSQIKGVIAAKLVGIKVIWELNDTYAPKIVRVIFSLVSYFADGYIFASNKTREYYLNLISNKKFFFLIQSPVNVSVFNPESKLVIDKFLKKKKLKKKIIIGTVGNINPNKGFTTFIEAASKLSFFEKKIVFLIVGPIYKSQKKYFNSLLKLIKSYGINNLYFIGSREDVRPILKSIDIYICSSNNESSPLSVWEAMAMKKAVISTDVGDIKKFIKNGRNGFLVKVDDAENIKKKIINLIENPKRRKKFGSLSRKIVQKKLSLDLCVNLHYAAYLKMTS